MKIAKRTAAPLGALLFAGLLGGATTYAAALPAAAPASGGPAATPGEASAADRADVERRLEEARARLDAAANDVAELSGQLGGRYVVTLREQGFGPPRSMLGIQFEPRRGEAGVRVAAVSPGGAAEEAGVKAGDVIVAIDGVDLRKSDDPGRALMRQVRELAPDQKVQLRVERDGRAREITATPRAAPMGPMAGMAPGGAMGPGGMRGMGGMHPPIPPMPMMPPGGPGMRGGPDGGPGGGPGERPGRGRMLSGDLELADLSPRLGGYFGAKGGVLVVRAGTDGALKLQDGDVITAIDGREPTSAVHAMRILRSYQPDEKLQLRLLRDRKPLSLETTLTRGRSDGGARGGPHEGMSGPP